MLYALCSMLFFALCASAHAGPANVTTRGGQVAPRTRTASAGVMPPAPAPAPVVEEAPSAPPPPPPPFDPRVNFNLVFTGANQDVGDGGGALAEALRRQQAVQPQGVLFTPPQNNVITSSCDEAMRVCMEQQCGEDFTRCATDSDAIWGIKIESCARGANCSARETALFSVEIKADRDLNATVVGFRDANQCGEDYNLCIMEHCSQQFSVTDRFSRSNRSIRIGGTPYVNCLSRQAGEAAVQACRHIADRCRAADSGLQARTLEALGIMRVAMEREAMEAERRLYTMRGQMEAGCRNIGGMFDQRSFECLFNLTMRASGDWDGVVASRTVNAGTEFMCTPEWFGVDLTMYLENIARAEREARGAQAATTGAMYGMATALVASGAINRAMDRRSAGRDQCEAEGRRWVAWRNACVDPNEDDGSSGDTGGGGGSDSTGGGGGAPPPGAGGDNNNNASPCAPGQEYSGGVCVPCRLNQIVNASHRCEACRADRIPNENQTECVQCRLGTRPGTDGTACEPCPAGHISPRGGVCTPCPEGQQPNEARTACAAPTSRTQSKCGADATEMRTSPITRQPAGVRPCPTLPAGASRGQEWCEESTGRWRGVCSVLECNDTHTHRGSPHWDCVPR